MVTELYQFIKDGRHLWQRHYDHCRGDGMRQYDGIVYIILEHYSAAQAVNLFGSFGDTAIFKGIR